MNWNKGWARAGATAVALLAAGTLATPAGAEHPPLTPSLTLEPSGAAPVGWLLAEECNDVAPPIVLPQSGLRRPVAVAAGCAPPSLRAPSVTLAAPGAFTLRANMRFATMTAGYEAADGGSLAAPVVSQVDETTWTLALPALPGDTTLYATGRYAERGSETFYLTVRPAAAPPVGPPVPPGVAEQSGAGEVAIVRASRRGRVATLVVDATPGAVSAYLTIGLRRRTAVARATVKRAGQVRLRIPLGRLSARALAGAGVTVVLRPADGGKQVRAGVRWKAAVASR